MLKATVNNAREYQVEQKQDLITVNGQAFDWDLAQLAPGKYHIIKDGQGYQIEVMTSEAEGKQLTLKINGQSHEVQLQDHMDLLLEKLGIDASADQGMQDLKAPMPGLVVEVFVQPGDMVAKGDKLMTLEAMKMENILKAQGDGEVKSVQVGKGDSVEKNQVMIQF